jgi:hypothetical protein
VTFSQLSRLSVAIPLAFAATGMVHASLNAQSVSRGYDGAWQVVGLTVKGTGLSDGTGVVLASGAQQNPGSIYATDRQYQAMEERP